MNRMQTNPYADSPMRRLDPAQSAAARGAASVQLTLAGPGAGKTSTLTGRFLHLIRRGVDPARLLALTYTRKAADEMAGRIARLLDLPSAHGLRISTFHAFAYRQLRRHPGAAGLAEGFPLWGPAEQRQAFSARHMWWSEEEDILDIIGGAKERLLAPADLEAAARLNDDAALLKAAAFFRVYEEARREAGAIDFSDMVPLLVRSMKESEACREAIAGSCDHLLVDEYQDVNPGQIRLIDLFVKAGARLWAVGDDDQTLYEFRASDVRHILDFDRKYPGAALHVLDRNYRSAPEIVEAAKRVIRHNRERRDKDYKAVASEPGEIVIRGYSTPDIEARQVACAVAELLARGLAPERIAILYRSAAVGLPFQTALKEKGVPFDVRGAADMWQGAAARLMVGGLHYLRDGASSAAMTRLGGGRRSELVRSQLDKAPAAVRRDFTIARRHARRVAIEALPRSAPNRERTEWVSLVDAVTALARSCASLDQLEMKIAEQSRALRSPPEGAVALSTIHSAKGLEWDAVFLAGLEDGVLPHVHARDIEGERRVAYVGMTRARRLLGLTYAAWRFGEAMRPSPFLFELTGRAERLHWWTGPGLDGADARLPLLTAEEKSRPARGASPPAGGGTWRTGQRTRPAATKAGLSRPGGETSSPRTVRRPPPV